MEVLARQLPATISHGGHLETLVPIREAASTHMAGVGTTGQLDAQDVGAMRHVAIVQIIGIIGTDQADVHAFLGWFDISFSCCHKPVNFSTGPQAKVRHIHPIHSHIPFLQLATTEHLDRHHMCVRGPADTPQYTHWKQTVFYTPDTLTVSEGEVVRGTLSCAPNARNNRDLDIEIDYEVEGQAESKGRMVYKMYVLTYPFLLRGLRW
jgi:hypothetical protein